MGTKDITNTITKTLGIDRLNAMQEAVKASRSHRLILLSPTGTGKTIAFSVFLFRNLSLSATSSSASVQGLVIAPSRELVRQIYDVLRAVGARLNCKVTALYGGNSFVDETASLQGATPTIIVATPGRLLDHIQRGTLDVDHVKVVVLDEYDKILELGFQDQMKQIFRYLSGTGIVKNGTKHLSRPENLMVTSATALEEWPDFVDVTKAEIINFTVETPIETRIRIMQVPSHSRDKLETLAALIRSVASEGPIIVFVNHRESAERVSDFLKKQHISVVLYHGGLDQQQREIALSKFHSRAAKVLVATDLAGRGLDIDDVASVIHYHPAGDKQIWTHRNGRTARINKTGQVYVITHPDEDIPDFVNFENEYYPDMTASVKVKAEYELIYLDKGKRDKLSRGDIAGFVMKKANVPFDAVGKITVGSHYSLVAVKPEYVEAVIEASHSDKLKNTRVRASLID